MSLHREDWGFAAGGNWARASMFSLDHGLRSSRLPSWPRSKALRRTDVEAQPAGRRRRPAGSDVRRCRLVLGSLRHVALGKIQARSFFWRSRRFRSFRLALVSSDFWTRSVLRLESQRRRSAARRKSCALNPLQAICHVTCCHGVGVGDQRDWTGGQTWQRVSEVEKGG